MDRQRSSGILLHITSLPGPYGIGDLGPSAYAFADFLEATHQHLWQILPLVPVGLGYSPYAGLSTFAGNPMLISIDTLLKQRLLTRQDLKDYPSFSEEEVDFEQVFPAKRKLLTCAFERFIAGQSEVDKDAFNQFCTRQAAWLDDYALFMALREQHGNTVWTDWDIPLATREPEALAVAYAANERAVGMHKFWQYLFDEQWVALRQYCNSKGIKIFGDLPIYVAHDSADVWASPHLFHLDDTGNPTVVAGVPPDYFSETGQRWGNPIYRWNQMKETGYQWWAQRFARLLEQVDLVRLDHFRGFAAYWEVPASEETAVHGRWVQGPGTHLFQTLQARLGALPVIAENLGFITEDVTALMEAFQFPGMAILQFGFDTDANDSFLPHNYSKNLVAYTGTHDNDTVVGWWCDTQSTQSQEAIQKAHTFCASYLNLDGQEEVHWAFIRSLFASVAERVVIPLQDLLGLGTDARMNIPGTSTDNWSWRYDPTLLTPALTDRLSTFTRIYGRT